MTERCPWCGEDPLYVRYHDEEWGLPVYEGRALFQKLYLDGVQAGLSWITVLRKREHYYQAMDGLDPERMARYSDARLAELMQDRGLIRNRLKMQAARNNAQAFLAMQEQGLDFGDWLWGFVEGRPLVERRQSMEQVPAETELSRRVSKELRKRGFQFVGPTIVYAFLQATGLVNDHLLSCWRWKACQAASGSD
ncbi:MAG: DNA-3-methyladenine glycosylase I [Planctomycetota bacterium]|nr:MAG: DNA-3-methyladenine glycosylase I [Planctomycetota bacterium]